MLTQRSVRPRLRQVVPGQRVRVPSWTPNALAAKTRPHVVLVELRQVAGKTYRVEVPCPTAESFYIVENPYIHKGAMNA